MWKQFDPKGAAIGLGLLLIFLLVAAAVTLPFRKTITIRIDLPPAKAAPPR